MKRSMIVVMALWALVLMGLSACGRKSDSAPQETTAEQVPGQIAETGTAAAAPDRMSDSDLEEYRLGEKYLNLDAYMEHDGRISENTTDLSLSTIRIDDTDFQIGMSYAEVVQLGYQPDDPSFADKTPQCLCVISDFNNEKAGTIRLGFAAKTSHDETSTVSSDGCFLYLISAKTVRN